MGLNGIDISGWQEGIDLSAVAADFVIKPEPVPISGVVAVLAKVKYEGVPPVPSTGVATAPSSYRTQPTASVSNRGFIEV